MEDIVRVGKISSIDYGTGMVRVTYSDRDSSTTTDMPYINFNNEYSMPKIGEQVLAVHMSNGTSRGIVIGTMWNQNNVPPVSGEGVYRKEYSNKSGKAYSEYSDASGTYSIVVPGISLSGKNISLKATSTLSLADGSYSTTLSYIMGQIAKIGCEGGILDRLDAAEEDLKTAKEDIEELKEKV